MGIALLKDEFNDGKIADFWEVWPQVGAVLEEKNGQFVWYCDTNCLNIWAFQTLQIHTSSDIWAKLTLPTAAELIGNDANAGIWFSWWNDWSGADIGIFYSDSGETMQDVPISPRQFVLYADGYDYNGVDWDPEFYDVFKLLGQDNNVVFVRMKWDGQFMSYYYALTEPCVDGDWIEICPRYEVNLADDSIYGQPNIGFSQWGSAGNHTDKTFSVDFFRLWPGSELLDQQRVDLVDVFYNVEEFAEEIIYEPRGGDPVGIRAVLLTQDDVLTEEGIIGDVQRIRVRSCDVNIPGRDSLILHGKRWFVLRNVGGGPHIGEWELEISKGETRVL